MSRLAKMYIALLLALASSGLLVALTIFWGRPPDFLFGFGLAQDVAEAQHGVGGSSGASYEGLYRRSC